VTHGGSLVAGLKSRTQAVLRDHFFSSLACQLGLPDTGLDARGAVDYHADYWLSLGVDVLGGVPAVDRPAVTAIMELADSADDEKFDVWVGRGHFVLCELGQPEIWSELDGREADLSLVGSVVLNPQTGELAEELDDIIQGLGSNFLIVNHVEVRPELRGMSFGLLGTGLVVQHLSGMAVCAALYPKGPGAETVADRATGHKALSHHWSRLGFVRFQDDVCVLDLGLVTLDQAMAQLHTARPLAVVQS
jgi:hypothetical protein